MALSREGSYMPQQWFRMNVVVAVAIVAALCGSGVASAAAPATINYQGFLTDQKSGVPVNANVQVVFAIYDSTSLGAALYTETQTLAVSNGVINAQIGSVTPFPATLAFDKPYWLEVTVGSDTLTPRQALTSSAYSQTASGVTSFGSGNTKAGDGALLSNTLGILNSAAGQGALLSNTTGTANTATGHGALVNNTTGGSNTASGQAALQLNTTGSANTGTGQSALYSNSTGSHNIGIGFAGGSSIVNGSYNIAIGSPGAASDNGIIRIGDATNSKGAFVYGIRGVAPAKDDGQPVVVSSEGQLATVPNITLTSAGLGLGATTRQMLNLWNTSYGIGVQANMLYLRTASGFGWFQGGVHSDTWNDPGAGGRRLMGLSEQGLRVVGSDPAGANDISLLADGSIHAKVVNTTSDRNAKENFADIDTRAVLAKVVQLPLQTWNYRSDEQKVKHVGPVAQDFHAAFNVGADDTHIATVDADGVALAAIQALYRLVQEKDAELAELRSTNTALLARVDALEASSGAQMALLKQAVERLPTRNAQPSKAVLTQASR
jgi:hypothetical protein